MSDGTISENFVRDVCVNGDLNTLRTMHRYIKAEAERMEQLANYILGEILKRENEPTEDELWRELYKGK